MSGRWLSGKVGAAALTLLFVLIFNFFLTLLMNLLFPAGLGKH